MSENTNNMLITDQNNLIYVDLCKLFPSPENSYDTEDISDLVTSIKCCGLLTPLTVIGPTDDGGYEIISGERRYRSLRKINEEIPGFMEQVPCYLIGASNMDTIRKKIAIELSNLEARDEFDRDAHRFEVISLYHELAAKGDIKEQELVSQIGSAMKLSPRYSRMYMAVFTKGSDKLKAAVLSDKTKPSDDGTPVHVPVSVASRVASQDEEFQENFLEMVNKGVKPEKALKVVQENRKGQEASDIKDTKIEDEDTGVQPADIPDEDEVEDTPPVETETAAADDGDDDEPQQRFSGRNDPSNYGIDDSDEYADAPVPNEPPVKLPKRSERASLSESDNLILDAVRRGEELDISQVDVLGLVRGLNTPSSELNIDTTGEFHGMASETEEKTAKDVRVIVRRWIRGIDNKLKRGIELDTEDEEIMGVLRELLDTYMDKYSTI